MRRRLTYVSSIQGRVDPTRLTLSCHVLPETRMPVTLKLYHKDTSHYIRIVTY